MYYLFTVYSLKIAHPIVYVIKTINSISETVRIQVKKTLRIHTCTISKLEPFLLRYYRISGYFFYRVHPFSIMFVRVSES